MNKKREKKLLKEILKMPKKLPESKTPVVLSPSSYKQLFKDLGDRARITVKATKLKPNQKRKVV